VAFWNKNAATAAEIFRPRILDLSRALSRSRKGTTGTELTYDGERHLLLFGPNGSGKGTRLLVNNLLRI
jgi:type IV secretory pathway TraG/TraD family ATPase VirD4